MTENLASGVKGFNPAAHKFGGAPFVATVFLSASLVFLVQPMFARMATPLLGGSPNVWNVSLVCFQAALLAGYAYAHVLNHFLKTVKAQVAVHAAILVLAALVLPFQLSGMFGAPDPARPALWLIGVFAVSIAPPFAVISATAPLIQAWYARTGRADAQDPYHLYAASNAGSLLGLAAYPLVFEPLATLADQAAGWSAGYVLLGLLLVACGLMAMRGPGMVAAQSMATAERQAAAPERIWRQRAWWVVLAFVPSSLLVGVTTHIATDIASAPFLWAPPLMLYIASFIIVFAKRPVVGMKLMRHLVPILAGVALFTLSRMSGLPTVINFGVHLLVLFAAAIACHGLLAADRPETGRLTEFYLLMSLGGVLGGAFNALLVPVIFSTVAEYPLMLIAVILLMPQPYWIGPKKIYIWMGVAVGALVLAFSAHLLPVLSGDVFKTFYFLLLVTLAALFMGYGSRVAGAIAASVLWIIGAMASPTAGGYSERGFFGVVKILERGDYRVLVHGRTLHGAQVSGADALRPTTYYAPEAPMGQAFSAHDRPGNVGIIGLGVGSVACYARPGQDYTFYEIDPIVARIAGDPARFTYLSDCAPGARIVLGDGRLKLAEEPEGFYDLLLIDAFSSDSVPAHLLTEQALRLYLSRVRDDGVVLFHVTNRYMALEAVVARLAGQAGVPARVQYFQPEESDGYRVLGSGVIALAHNEAALEAYRQEAGWDVLTSDGGRAWSDDYSNIPGAIFDRMVRKRR